MALYKDLLGHNLEKFAGITVFDATLYDGDKPLVTFDTLTVSSVSVESEQKEIRGGKGADLLISYDYAKSATLEITDALASIYSLKYIWGAQIKHEDISALVRRTFNPEDIFQTKKSGQDLIIDTSKNIEIGNNYKDETLATFLLIGKDGKTQHYIDTELVDIGGGDYKLRIKETNPQLHIVLNTIQKVIVYYTIELANEPKESHIYELTLTNTDFPRVMRLVGETEFLDQKTGRKINAQIEIPRFKPSANFELTFEAEGDASVFDFSGVALSDDENLVIIKTLGYEAPIDNRVIYEIPATDEVEVPEFTKEQLEEISIWLEDNNEWVPYVVDGVANTSVNAVWEDDWDLNEQFILKVIVTDTLYFVDGTIENPTGSSIKVMVYWPKLSTGMNPEE